LTRKKHLCLVIGAAFSPPLLKAGVEDVVGQLRVELRVVEVLEVVVGREPDVADLGDVGGRPLADALDRFLDRLLLFLPRQLVDVLLQLAEDLVPEALGRVSVSAKNNSICNIITTELIFPTFLFSSIQTFFLNLFLDKSYFKGPKYCSDMDTYMMEPVNI
jgi:hypothetical protein